MSEVDKSQLMRYIDIEKEIQQLESQNALKNYEVRKKAATDVAETIKSVEITLQQLQLQTRKEKADVDDMQKKSIKDMFKDESSFNQKLSREQKEKADVDDLYNGSIKQIIEDKQHENRMSKEQEEYLEAKNKEEVARQQKEDLEKQRQEMEQQANEMQAPADKLSNLYKERDNLLSDIFGGEYGSDRENMLEAEFDSLMDKKQRVAVAHHKWNQARVLLHHAVCQLTHSVHKWKSMETIPQHASDIRYKVATEARNNNIAAITNLMSCARFLGNKIEFPYCKKEEMQTLERATNNIYIDMQEPSRYKHAMSCYVVTMKRAAALLQWFDTVIEGTIRKDLLSVTETARKIEKDLRAERIKLIRDKVAECGGDVNALTDADQTKLSDEDMDMKGIGITRPAPVGDDMGIGDAQVNEPPPSAPTPLPLTELAPCPTESDLFGDISDLKERYKKDTEEYMKVQQLNKDRMEQGLQAKLAARRHRRI